MAYKVSYKVVSEQGEQLKNISKDMENYINEVNQIVSKLGNDELLQSVRADLNKFKQQLEEEKTILNLAGSVITDVIKSYTGVEKKSVQKVDKAKAHNRDFYKRPVAVASAGGVSAGTAAAGAATAGATTVNAANVSYSSSTTNVFSADFGGGSGASAAAEPSVGAGAATAGFMSSIGSVASKATGGNMAGGIAAAAGMTAAVGAGVAGVIIADKKAKEAAEAAIEAEEEAENREL